MVMILGWTVGLLFVEGLMLYCLSKVERLQHHLRLGGLRSSLLVSQYMEYCIY